MKAWLGVARLQTSLLPYLVGIMPLLIAVTDMSWIAKVMLAVAWMSFHLALARIANAIVGVDYTIAKIFVVNRAIGHAIFDKLKNEETVAAIIGDDDQREKLADQLDATKDIATIFQVFVYLVFTGLFFALTFYHTEMSDWFRQLWRQ